MSGLPSGWIVAALGEVADVQLGKMLDRKRTEGTSLPYLRNVNVRWGHIDVSDLLQMPFRDHELGRYAVKPGDVMVCEGGEPGRAAVWTRHDEGIKYQKALHRVRVGAGLLPNWLVYQLHLDASNGRLAKQFTGTTIGHIPREAIVEYRLRLAPLPEQQRIVEAIESYFTRLDDAVATLERVQRNLKRYRASVLKAAVEGRLVPTEAELARAESRDYEPASVLLERILAERRRGWHEAGGRGKYQEPVAPDTTGLPELPEGWCWARIEQTATLVTDGNHNPPRRVSVGIPHLTAKHIKNWTIGFTGCSFVSADGFEKTRSRYEPKPGDVIITCVGTVGETAVVPVDCVFSADRNLAGIRLLNAGVTPRYLMYALSSPIIRRKVEAASGSTAQPHLYLADIRSLSVPVPPLAEQNRILQVVEERLSDTAAIEQQVEVDNRRCARLRQSILKWAFEGRLADQDPSDEPASVLLERIRSETSSSRQRASKRARPAP